MGAGDEDAAAGERDALDGDGLADRADQLAALVTIPMSRFSAQWERHHVKTADQILERLTS
ncbi:hypothetical protein GCM10009548_87120 [Streptomyces malaysiensis subsp. malaysiensis]